MALFFFFNTGLNTFSTEFKEVQYFELCLNEDEIEDQTVKNM